jgi:hypothetical protein
MRPARFAITLLIFVSGCSEHRSGTTGPPPASAYTESFKNFDELADFISSSGSLEIYEGLPHDVWERNAYESEKSSKDTVQIEGTYFYRKPVEVPEEAKRQLKTLSVAKSSFVPYGGPNACGGFHADWCLVWKNGDDVRSVHICFGCHEMMSFKNGTRQVYCDISDQSRFQALLNPLRAQRPSESRSNR